MELVVYIISDTTGGHDGNQYLNDTWEYDMKTNSWVQLFPSNAPEPRNHHLAAYDSNEEKHVIFGGCTSNGVQSNTWEYDYSTNNWTEVNPSTSPQARRRADMVFDSKNNLIFLYGGYNQCSFGSVLGDMWAYNVTNSTWTELNPANSPGPRYDHQMVYNKALNKILLFGGDDGSGSLSNYTWEYDYSTNSWTHLNPASNPPNSRKHPHMVYDSNENYTILFGGKEAGSSTFNKEIWIYDRTSNDWINISDSIKPPKRGWGSIAYSSKHNRSVLFGGDQSGTQLNDTWVFSFDQTGIFPTARTGANSVSIDKHSKHFVFGGFNDSTNNNLGDWWTYNVETNYWNNLTTNNGPSPRRHHAIASD